MTDVLAVLSGSLVGFLLGLLGGGGSILAVPLLLVAGGLSCLGLALRSKEASSSHDPALAFASCLKKP